MGAAVPAVVIAGGVWWLAGESVSTQERGNNEPDLNTPLCRYVPIPVKRLAAAAVLLMVAACVGGYLLTPKWRKLCVASNSVLADPLRDFTNCKRQGAAFGHRKNRANPRIASNRRSWASIICRNAYDNALLAYRQALRLRGDNAQLFAALAAVLYCRPGNI